MPGIALISGGIDSPVAAHLIAKRGETLLPLFFNNYPFTGENTKQRALKTIRKLQTIHKNILDPVILDHGQALEKYAQTCERKYQCVFCKRMMVRVASALAEQEGASYLVMGDSLGQVASQTLQNLYVVEQAATIPVVRPLISMDKVEIEKIAKEIETFNISIERALCCSIVPDKPSTRAQLDTILAEEAKLDIDALVEQSMASKTFKP